MELASLSHCLNKEYIHYFRKLAENEIKIIIFNEEYTYDILLECFASNDVINDYLRWSYRNGKFTVGTIKATLDADDKLLSEIKRQSAIKRSDFYSDFFTKVRGNKEEGDNLGEELIALCVSTLSFLPGLPAKNICVITDDRGAAIKIDSLMKKTREFNNNTKIGLFSTLKIIQHIFNECNTISEDKMKNIIEKGSSGVVRVLAVTAMDFEPCLISVKSDDLVKKIKEPNGIDTIF